MSKNLSVVLAHSLGKDAARERLTSGIPKFEQTFGKTATLERTDWAGDTLSFSIRALGVEATGTATVMDHEVRIEANLPMVLAPFSGTVERLVAEHGGQLLRPVIDRRAIARKARQGFRAAGGNWRELSKDEKKQLKEQARQELLAGAPASQSAP